MRRYSLQGGFTLIELLIVIAIIAIIASVTFVALNPLQRFRDARDSSRWSDISALTNAIKVDQIDNTGAYISSIASTTIAEVYLIGTAGSGCDSYTCDTAITQAACLDLTGLVTEGYLGDVPVSPTGDTAWDSTATGYSLTRNSNGSITVRACESENTPEISLTR